MIHLDDELASEYLAECREHLATLETGLLAMEEEPEEADGYLINRAFRAVHSVKGGAGVFDLVKIRELAHQTEDVLALFRTGDMIPTPPRVRVLLRATDRLRDMIHNPGESNHADISGIVAALTRLRKDGPAAEISTSEAASAREVPKGLRTLVVEDDFASRLLLQTFLSRYGECHIAVNGREAVDGYKLAWESGLRYDLICMDIMMPEMDGREAVRQVRAIEESHDVLSTRGAKIIMTTTVRDIKAVVRCFTDLCDAYLIKPIDLAKLLGHMKSYQLIQ